MYGFQSKHGERFPGRYSSPERTQKLIEWMDKNHLAGAPHLLVEYPDVE